MRRRYCIDDKYIILNRNILIPPDVDPLHAPIGNKNVKNIMAKLPQDSISLFENPVEVKIDIIENAEYRTLSDMEMLCCVVK